MLITGHGPTHPLGCAWAAPRRVAGEGAAHWLGTGQNSCSPRLSWFTFPFLARYCWPRCQCPRDGSTICPWTVGVGCKAEAGPLEQNRPRTAGPKEDAKHQQTSLCFLAQQMPKSTFEILPIGPLSRWSSVNRWFSISRWFFSPSRGRLDD